MKTNKHKFKKAITNCLKAVWVICFLLTGSFLTRVSCQTYGNVAIGGGGFVSGIVTNKKQPELVYARTDVGGAYRWDSTNNRWIPLLDWVSEGQVGYMGVESIATDPVEPNKLYMLVGTSYFNNGNTAILRSDDYGQTFSITDVTSQFKANGNGMGRQSGEKLVIDPNNNNILYTGTRYNGLFKSTDAGVSWTRGSALNVTSTPNENGISLVVLDPSSVSGGATQRIFVGVSQTGNNFYRSDDGGQTFSVVAGAPTDLMPQRAVLASDGNLYITYGNGAGPFGHWALPEPFDQGKIMKYNVQSGTWTDVSPVGFTGPFGGISVDPGNPNRLVASTINTWLLQHDNAYGDRFFLSTDGGTTWTDVVARGFQLDPNGVSWISSAAIHWAGCIEFDPFDTKRVWVTSGNGVFRTDDIDATTCIWKFQVAGLEETVPTNLVSIPNGPLVSSVGDYDGFINTDPNTYGQMFTPTMGSTTGLAVAPQSPNVMLRKGAKMYYTTNSGQSWTQCTMHGPNGQVAISGDGSVFLDCPDQSDTTYRSTDNGATWSVVSSMNVTGARPTADPVNPDNFYVYDPGSGNILVSTDKGATFAATGSTFNNGSNRMALTPGHEGDIWVALYWGGLQHSTNSGQTFTVINGITYCSAVGTGKAAPNASYPTIYIWATINNVTGLYRSIDQGNTWLQINDTTHQWGGPGNGQFVIGDQNVYGRVYMSTVGRGIVYDESADVTIPVSGVTVSPSSTAVSVGGTRQLTTTVTPSSATNKAVSWSSSDTTVATVDASGVISGVKVGTAVITATTQDGGFQATCNVTVTNASTGGGTGTILREYWTGISGVNVTDLTSNSNYPNNPTGSEQLTSLEGPTNWADNYGDRIRGYIYPPTTGDYTFWIAADDYANLYLSTDDNPANATEIAYVSGWTNPLEWTKYASQQSATISLVAGQKYYIEVLHKEGSGGDNVAVAWQGPGITQAVIDGAYLSPFIVGGGTSNSNPTASITATPLSGTVPLTVSFSASGSTDPDGDVLSYSWTFGDGGTATGVAPQHTYNTAGTFTATATVNDGNGGSDNASVNITASNPTTTYTLGTSANGSGSISLSPTGGTYDAGTVVTVTANPGSGYTFSSWGGDLSGSTNPTTITMNGNKSITATFTQIQTQQYTLSTSVTGSGSVSLNPSGGVYNAGTVVTLTATASSGYSFTNWSGDLTGTTSPATITMNSDKSVTAVFTANNTGGTPCANPVTISIPFTQDGIGNYCWVTSTAISYINSWNLDTLKINGVDYTNTWSNNLPPAINGQWYIHYVGSFDWSHFEAPQAKSAESSLTENNTAVKVYPNPLNGKILNIQLSGTEIPGFVSIIDLNGKTVLKKTVNTDRSIKLELDVNPGIYAIQFIYKDKTVVKKLVVR